MVQHVDVFTGESVLVAIAYDAARHQELARICGTTEPAALHSSATEAIRTLGRALSLTFCAVELVGHDVDSGESLFRAYVAVRETCNRCGGQTDSACRCCGGTGFRECTPENLPASAIRLGPFVRSKKSIAEPVQRQR